MNISMEMIQEGINHIENDLFSSHEVIRWISKKYPKEYIEDLYVLREIEDPFRKCHSDIACLIRDSAMVKPVEKIETNNFRNNYSPNFKWQKK